MSLDVYLVKDYEVLLIEWKKNRERSLSLTNNLELRSIIEEYYKDRKPIEDDVLFDSNITHNLGKMAKEAGIYYHLWRPSEINIIYARELIQPLSNALDVMKSNPIKFKEFDSDNGWGIYEDFLPWIEEYLNACIEYPDSIIEVSI